MRFYINGWEESRNYFLSFGFTSEEKQRMINGETIHRGDNVFFIVVD